MSKATGIPGQPAPASLKPGRGLVLRPTMPPNSGAACPGLIEAGFRQIKQRNARPNSGAACPGLIEAESHAAEAGDRNGNSGAACPGLIEARHGCIRTAATPRNSGAACPGLIEAGAIWRCRNRAALRIPGQPAPASLKPHQFFLAARRVGGIPGQPAPASLKRKSKEILKAGSGMNSGAACPGLIEAISERLIALRRVLEFRGSLPRPH